MCGRYSLAVSEFSQIRLEYRVEIRFELEWKARYNIAPTWLPGYEVPIVCQERGRERELLMARFWMIPSFWKRPLAALPTAFNARSEELSKKPFWTQSFERRRCLVPTTGWREFMGPKGGRRPFQFAYERPTAFAGVWDEWHSPDGEVATSFAIVTVAANDVVRPIHDRMPLVLDAATYAAWLDPERLAERALSECVQAAESRQGLSVYECDPVGNSVRVEGEQCIAPLRSGQLGLF